MIRCSEFSRILRDHDVRFYTGVPDSLLKAICGYFSDQFKESHIIAANEGNAMAIAAGYHFATGAIPLVYMQNSGLGNAVNPITSLMSEDVYQIPVMLLIGWRGEPGVKDEPQHVTQGKISREMLDLLKVPFLEITGDSQGLDASIGDLVAVARKRSCPVALLVSKGAFEPYSCKGEPEHASMSREEAVITLAEKVSSPESLIVSTTGYLSRELYEYRRRDASKVVDFYNVGSMGHVSQIALGLAKGTPKRKIFCFDGDGAALMHLGGLAIVAAERLENYYYVLFNNAAHDSVGGQPTVARELDFQKIALGFGFKKYLRAETVDELARAAQILVEDTGPAFLEVVVTKGAREDLGRPAETPAENKIAFMKYLQGQ